MDRKYALIKICDGDYICPSNDATRLWRFNKYIDGPCLGLDWPKDREVWASSYAPMPNDPISVGEIDDLHWENWSGPHDTRREAIAEAFRV